MEVITNDQNGDFENTPIFPSEENWLGFRRRLSFPSGQETMLASGLQTVFSVTHPDHSTTQAGSSAITEMEMLTHSFAFL
jgi:hypothetical protein